MPDLEVLKKTYRGPVPEWPLINPSPRELELWAEMWRKPQAALWVVSTPAHTVGMHVRTLVEIENGRDGSAMRRVAHSQAVALLLTPTSLRRAGYRISPVEAVISGELDASSRDT
ncbi:hypothetical protein [Microbacterium sp. Leaf179]|uniref:hypothetical protein n=1 Tax=Microbacterium sp. Leaf179 TaxID=1736288 RepID=UPI0006F75EC0|nr:hypothetical protein [Microbacterium sp. Leaf179]KQR86741.1 hypothetical protein ASF96_10495 [Microbacterium sp. Leaf179]